MQPDISRAALVVAALLLAPFSASATAQVAVAADLVPEPAKIDFKDVYDGEEVKTNLQFKNTGTLPWPVQQVRTSCGCTVARLKGPDGADIPNKPTPNKALITLQPGEALDVEVEFVTANQRGVVEKTVQCFHVDPAQGSVDVKVAARVSKALVVSPNLVNLNSIGKRDVVKKTITIESQEIGPWSIADFESAIATMPLPECMTFEVVEEKDNAKSIELRIEGSRPVGTISAKVRAKIDHARVKYVEFFVSGVVMPDVTFDSGDKTFPQSINFDKLDPGATATRTLTITNKDPETPYVLEEIDLLTSKSEFFTYELRTIEEGVQYAVDLTADAAIGQSFFRGNLVLIASGHPDVPKKTVPFHGWVNKE